MKKIKKIAAAFLAGVFVCAGVFAGCKKEKEELIFCMPDGAPSLAVAGLMAKDSAEDGVAYRVVAPTKIASKVTAKSEKENADLCVLPMTAASKLLGNGERYTLLGTVTRGNLYLISKTGTAVDDLSLLVGKKVGVLQIKEVPGLTFKATLQSQGVPFQELVEGVSLDESKVNLLPLSGVDMVGVLEAEYYLVAEPAATAQKGKGYTVVGDLQALYGEGKGYPQAALVAKNSLVEKRGEWLVEYVAELETSLSFAKSASGGELVEIITAHLEDKTASSSLKAPLLTGEVVSRCGLAFTYAVEGRGEIEGFLSNLLSVAPQATALPSENFYWKK